MANKVLLKKKPQTEIFVKFRNGNERIYKMKVLETHSNGDVRLIDGSVIQKDEILETIKTK